MKFYYVYLLIFSLLQLQPSNAVATCQPLSKTKETTFIIKQFGEVLTLWCPSHQCAATHGDICNFTKLNGVTGNFESIHQGKKFSKTITDITDSGTYCSMPHCAANNTEPCCINIQARSEITFHMNDTAYIHQNYTASCTVRANPTMNLYIYTQGCDFRPKMLQIDEYTTEAAIVINNMTSECTTITCATNLFQKSKTVELQLPLPEPTETTTSLIPTTQPVDYSSTMETHTPSSHAIEISPTQTPVSSAAANIHRNFIILMITCTVITLYIIYYL